MTFSIDKSFHQTNVTIFLNSGARLQGVLSLEGGIWLSTLDGMDKQQLNPALIATVAPSDAKPKNDGRYW